MQFLVLAYDGDDKGARQRRMKVREQHLEGVREGIKEGKHLYGGAILDDEGNMIGSVMIVDYPSKEVLEKEWLDNEPYVTGDVWRKIDIQPFRVAEVFM